MLLSIEEEYAAFDFDRAVWFLGAYIEGVVATEQERLSHMKSEKFKQSIIENRIRKILGLERLYRKV